MHHILRCSPIEQIEILKVYSFVSENFEDQTFDLYRLVHLVTGKWLASKARLLH